MLILSEQFCIYQISTSQVSSLINWGIGGYLGLERTLDCKFNNLFIAPPNNVPISVINLLIQKYSRIIQFNLRDALENLVLWSYCLDVEIDGGGVLGLEELCLILVCGC